MAIHIAGLVLGYWGGRRLGTRRAENTVAASFAGSQKTLPIGILVAENVARTGLPFAVFPMLMFHASQLVIDTIVADRVSECDAADGGLGRDALSRHVEPRSCTARSPAQTHCRHGSPGSGSPPCRGLAHR